jgi:Rrf2 family protein
MKLQQATWCAIWSIVELASRAGEQIGARELATTYGISQNHLAKVLRTLTKAKIVTSVRGPGGGFTFCGNAKRLTLFDIVALFEGEELSDALQDGDQPNSLAVELHRVMKEVDRMTFAILRSVTIQTIINNAQRSFHPESVAQHPPRRLEDAVRSVTNNRGELW